MKKPFAVFLLICGVALLLLAGWLELSRYPWRAAVIPPKAEDLPDPPPIVLAKEDREVELTNRDDLWSPTPEDYTQLPSEEQKEVPPPAAYVLLGAIKIPRLEVSEHILEGTDRQLRYGVGHLPGTAAPGTAGNCALAAHRNLSFRYLDLLKPGDQVVLSVGESIYTYEVYETLTVEPDALWVLDEVPGEAAIITLITCTPYLVSSHRLIVRARLV